MKLTTEELNLTFEYEGELFTGFIATIKKTSLGYSDRGIFSADLQLSWPGGGVTFGGYALDGKPERKGDNDWNAPRVPTKYGHAFIIEILKAVGVETWEELQGQRVVALFEGSGYAGSIIKGIMGMDSKEVFFPKYLSVSEEG